MKIGEERILPHDCRLRRLTDTDYSLGGRGFRLKSGRDSGASRDTPVITVDTPLIVFNSSKKRVALPGGMREFAGNVERIFRELDGQMIERWEVLNPPAAAAAAAGRTGDLSAAAERTSAPFNMRLGEERILLDLYEVTCLDTNRFRFRGPGFSVETTLSGPRQGTQISLDGPLVVHNPETGEIDIPEAMKTIGNTLKNLLTQLKDQS